MWLARLVGSEGTLVTILEAAVQLIPSPKHRVLLVAGFDDLATAGDHVPLVLEHKPIGLEGFDERFLLAVKTKGLRGKQFPDFPKGKGWLIIEFRRDDYHRRCSCRCRAMFPYNKKMSRLNLEFMKAKTSARFGPFVIPLWERFPAFRVNRIIGRVGRIQPSRQQKLEPTFEICKNF